MTVKLTICIVAYNNYKDIEDALKSIYRYTPSSLTKQIYIVDNGVAISDCKDNEDFKSFINGYEDIVYIDAGENIGFGKGHNRILNIIDSEYHAIVNPDVLLCEDSFSKIVNWMDANKEIGMVIPLIVDEKDNRQEVYRRELTVFDMFNRMFLKEAFKGRAKKHTMQDMNFKKPFNVPFGQGSFLVIRTELFKKLGGFDDNYFMYCEDADLCKRVNCISKLMYFPDTKVIHKWEKGSHKNKTLLKYHLNSTKYYFKKWGWKLF